MKEKRAFATGKDIAVLVAFAILVILAAVFVGGITLLDPLYVGLLAALVYMIFLAVYLSVRFPHIGNGTMPVGFSEHGGDLTAVMLETSHPMAICDEEGRMFCYNDPFQAASGYAMIPDHALFEDVCPVVPKEARPPELAPYRVHSFGNTLYTCEITEIRKGKNAPYLYVLTDATPIVEMSQTIVDVQKAHDNAQTAVAYIIIDNVEDLLQNIQEQFRLATAKVSDILHAWVADMNGVIRSYERDKYIAFFKYEGLKQCIENRFDVLDKIRSVRIGDQLPVTVSMGVSCIKDGSLAEREALAQEAMDMALQRGGDQVVCRSETGIDFYGGKTKAIYKRANVRARTMGTQLIRLMENADNVLIMGHQNGDYDSFGATVGMARFALQHFSPDRVHIVVNRADKNLRSCLEKAMEIEDYREMFCDPSDSLALVTPGTLLVVVDVNHFSHTECPRLLEIVDTVAIIDHHTQSAAFEKKIALLYIEPSASSASELVAEMLEQHLGAVSLEKVEAELMLSGILLDTKQLVRSTGPRTFGAARFLRGEGADPSATNELFKNEVADMRKQAQFLANTMIYREHIAIAVCEGNTDSSYRIIAAKAADSLLSGRGINASFALVEIGSRMHVSARSDGTVNVAKILEELHGGGHFDAAGAQIDASEESITKLKHAIDKHYGVEDS